MVVSTGARTGCDGVEGVGPGGVASHTGALLARGGAAPVNHGEYFGDSGDFDLARAPDAQGIGGPHAAFDEENHAPTS